MAALIEDEVDDGDAPPRMGNGGSVSGAGAAE